VEWASFLAEGADSELNLKFASLNPRNQATLRLRQYDVRQPWLVQLNDSSIGRLRIDENDLAVYLSIPPGLLQGDRNTLKIVQENDVVDDIRVGEIVLYDRPLDQLLAESAVEVTLRDAATGDALPGRITVVNEAGALQQLGAASNERLAVRPGIVYTSDGTAAFGLPAGDYTLYAGRGFEYSLDSVRVTLNEGDRVRQTMTIRREVPTPGYVSSDTHIHTWTHSGHGDATLQERLITLAGEGIEWPIATDHNVHIDYEATAEQLGVRPYFTPVIGNEVTTRIGHFNVFPVEPDARIPNHQLTDWDAIFDEVFQTPGVEIAILNHARDVHSEYRPFDPGHHNAVVGRNLDGWTLRANAMEIVNSSAQQADIMRLTRDWMGMLNGGRVLTPVGSSDSHDVGRYIVGQARTYIRTSDDDPAEIDQREAVDQFKAGRVMVSMGLLAEISIDGRYGPGDLAPASEEIEVAVRVLGPGWTRADRISLYANGRRLWTAPILEGDRPGVKWSGAWTLPRPAHDVYLVAVALGPGVRNGYWPLARPYQHEGPVWEPQVFGMTGAVWIDGDGDGSKTSAFEYADRLMDDAEGDWEQLFRNLARYDEAVASQAAYLIEATGEDLQDPSMKAIWQQAQPAVQSGVEAFLGGARR
jgi:hypothetical protein